MRLRVAEVNEKPVAEVLGDVPLVARDDLGAGRLIGADDLSEVLRVQPGGERRRADQVAEHHGELAALGL